MAREFADRFEVIEQLAAFCGDLDWPEDR